MYCKPLKVPGYTRKLGGDWTYSEKVLHVLRDYTDKSAMCFAFGLSYFHSCLLNNKLVVGGGIDAVLNLHLTQQLQSNILPCEEVAE